MITCNRCGNVAPAGAVHCQRCGAPLPGKVENTYSQGQGGQGQSGQTELPAWLESLRVGERPAAPAKSPSSFSASDLVEEGSLPSWMRPEQNGGSQPVPSSPPPPLRPASFPGPNTDEGTLAAKGFTARSLIDEQALPSWMKEGSGNNGVTETSGGPSNVAASSLVQQDALPDWMQNLQSPPASRARAPQQPSSGYLGASAAPASGMFPAQPVPPPSASPMPQIPPVLSASSTPPPSQPLWTTQSEPTPSSPPQGFSARDLVDQNSLPSWMGQQQGGAQPGATPNNRSDEISGGPPAQAGFSASSLLDKDALPPWLQEGGAQPGASPTSKSGEVSGGLPGQAGFSASSLLDKDALPPWLRESGQQQNMGDAASSRPASPIQGRQSGSFPVPNSSPQQNMPWQGAPPAQSAPAGNMPANASPNSISASSFIDMNALPEWLRSSAESQQGSMGAPSRPGTYSGPPRVENMRVPSRPRGEINPPEGSEVAANVFASMLGVASSAPNFPASPMPSPSQASPMPPAQAGMSSAANLPPGASRPLPQGMPPASNNTPGTPRPLQPGGGNPQAPQGYLGVYGGGASYPGNQNNYAIGNPPMGSPQIPANGLGIAPTPGAAGQAGEDRSGMKPAKRGLFNAIRDWFFR